MARKKVLVLSEAFGAGHTSAGKAVAEILKSDDVDVKVLELGKYLHPLWFDAIISVYVKTIEFRPEWWGKLYYYHQNHPLRSVPFFLHRLFYHDVFQLLISENPDLIICTHPFPAMVISRLKKKEDILCR